MTRGDVQVGNAPSSVLMAWCPTMDLLAYVTSENHIALHRLSWVKLCTFSENTSRITALAWSPDGRTLAILEVNPRLGGDLVCDVPPERARAFLERVEAWGK